MTELMQFKEELKRMKIEEAPFITRKLWYIMIQIINKIEELEKEQIEIEKFINELPKIKE